MAIRPASNARLEKMLTVGIIAITLTASAGCAGMSDTQQRRVTGGAMGAAGGYLYGKHEESEQAAYQKGYQAGKQNP